MTKVYSTKRSLVTSVIALMLCFSMLIGTTFAWFTDSVTSANNIIKSGNLDVEMYWADGTKAVPIVDADWKDASEGAIFEYANWEPGFTQVRHIKIANEGTLALKYQLAIAANGEVSELADVIDVYYVDPADMIADRTQLPADKKLGTLTKVLADLATTASGNLKAGEAHTVTLAFKMQESAGNEYMNKEIGSDFAVKLFATQLTSEEDSFGKDYDEKAEYDYFVATQTELAEAIANAAPGEVIVLGTDLKDVNANTAITVASGKEITLDLNGHKISATADKKGNQELFLVKGNMTVKNGSLEFVAKNNQEWNSMATLFDVTGGGVLNMEDVTANISGTDMNFIVHLNNWGAATLNVDDCDFTASYVAVRAFNSGYDMNTVTIKNTAFHSGRVFWVHNYVNDGPYDDDTLTLNIYGNGNTTDNAKPVRFGFTNAVYYDINGNLIP